MKWFLIIGIPPIILIGAFLFLNRNKDLRGSFVKSADGKTYLIVADDNGGGCEIIVDGKPWPHKTGEAGPISPGTHEIQCGKGWSSGIEFVIPKGTVYSFDYWGP